MLAGVKSAWYPELLSAPAIQVAATDMSSTNFDEVAFAGCVAKRPANLANKLLFITKLHRFSRSLSGTRHDDFQFARPARATLGPECHRSTDNVHTRGGSFAFGIGLGGLGSLGLWRWLWTLDPDRRHAFPLLPGTYSFCAFTAIPLKPRASPCRDRATPVLPSLAEKELAAP